MKAGKKSVHHTEILVAPTFFFVFVHSTQYVTELSGGHCVTRAPQPWSHRSLWHLGSVLLVLQNRGTHGAGAPRAFPEGISPFPAGTAPQHHQKTPGWAKAVPPNLLGLHIKGAERCPDLLGQGFRVQGSEGAGGVLRISGDTARGDHTAAGRRVQGKALWDTATREEEER